MRADKQFSAFPDKLDFLMRSSGGASAGLGYISGVAFRSYGSERSMNLDKSRGSTKEDADDPLSHDRARLRSRSRTKEDSEVTGGSLFNFLPLISSLRLMAISWKRPKQKNFKQSDESE